MVTPPAWRPDLVAPIDLVEEVARLGGYNDIPSLLPPARGGTGVTAAQLRRRTVGRAMAENGYVEVVPGSGGIVSRDSFGDAQLHVEWTAPLPAVGESQERGNSGVFLMGRYEVQVLDSYENKTYPDGQAAAVYGQFPPLVNASRPPGEWQTYDIIFHRPRFDAAGNVTSPARMTVLRSSFIEMRGCPVIYREKIANDR